MDPSMFSQYSPPSAAPNGLPQESKLATYMNRTTSTPTRPLTQTMGKLSLESSPQSIKKVMINEFIPMGYYQPSILPESPENSAPTAVMTAHMPMPTTSQVHQENVGGTTYFYSTNSDSLNTSGLNSSASMGSEACLASAMAPAGASPYASQMFAGTPPHLNPMNIKPGLAASFYQPETIRQEIYQRNDDVFLRADMRQFPDLPENVEMYTGLIPLESAAPHSLATSFRAAHRQTGEHFALRRLHACPAVPTKRLDLWKAIDHSNIVKLHEYFTTPAFGDHSMVLVYAYHPGSETLMNKYLSGGAGNSSTDANAYMDPFSSDPDAPRPYTHQKNAMLRAVACGALLPEAVLWSLLVQLSAGLRALHNAGLACRSLDPTKVVMNGPRVRITWGGAADALHANSNDIHQAQQDDLTALGRLALALACRTIHCDNLAASMDLVARTYSSDFKNVILYLLSSTNRRSLTDLMPMIGARYYTQIEALQRRADVFEDQLAHEIDNSRILRILIKLGVINERPELNLDGSWSETGDRYLLKLFRDRLFHGVSADGRPWIDLAHLTAALNNLDGGTEERVELISRDEQSVLVVTYAELKHCLESAFEEIMNLSRP